jgi:galactokinase
MLRALVVALALANLLFWAWSAGLLEGLGWEPARERDPTRLSQQVRPDAVRVLAPAAVKATVSPASAAGAASAASAASGTTTNLVCLETGPFAGAALDKAEAALAAAALPENSWVRVTQEVAAQYAVVLGPFESRDALQKKREEVARLKLPIEGLDLLVAGSNTQRPGLALGRYDTRAAAESALGALTQRGVRTARVSLLRIAGSESRLRIEGATPAQADQLRGLSSAALAGGFAPCATPVPLEPSAQTR